MLFGFIQPKVEGRGIDRNKGGREIDEDDKSVLRSRPSFRSRSLPHHHSPPVSLSPRPWPMFNPGAAKCHRPRTPPHSCVCRAFVTVANKVSPLSLPPSLSPSASFFTSSHPQSISHLMKFSFYHDSLNRYFCTSICVIKRFFLEFFFPSSYATKYNKKIIRFCNRISAIFAPQTVISIANWRGNILIFPYVRTRSGSGIIINYETFPRDGWTRGGVTKGMVTSGFSRAVSRGTRGYRQRYDQSFAIARGEHSSSLWDGWIGWGGKETAATRSCRKFGSIYRCE